MGEPGWPEPGHWVWRWDWGQWLWVDGAVPGIGVRASEGEGT